MSTAEKETLRNEISQWVNSIDNSDLLSLLNSIKTASVTEGAWWDLLTETERNNIQIGLDDLEKGKVVSSVDFWRKLIN